MAWLPDDVPAHNALNCQVNLSLGRPPGRPRNRWVDQIRNDNNLPPVDLSRGHRRVTLWPLPAKRRRQQHYIQKDAKHCLHYNRYFPLKCTTIKWVCGLHICNSCRLAGLLDMAEILFHTELSRSLRVEFLQLCSFLC